MVDTRMVDTFGGHSVVDTFGGHANWWTLVVDTQFGGHSGGHTMVDTLGFSIGPRYVGLDREVTLDTA